MKTLILAIEFPMTEKNYRDFVRRERRVGTERSGGRVGLEVYGKPGVCIGGTILEENREMEMFFGEMKRQFKSKPEEAQNT